MLKNMKFKNKIFSLIIIFFLFALTTAAGYHLLVNKVRDIGVQHSSEVMLEGYREELKDIVDVMAETLSSAAYGVTSEEAHYNLFSKLVNNVRFFPDKSGYIFIYKNGGEVFILPPSPELEGKNLIDLEDSNGKRVIHELNTVSNKGGGFVDYIWDKPNQGKTPKISYARMIPDQPYWIGTGVYVDNIDAKKAEINDAIDEYSKGYLIFLYAALAIIFILVIVPFSMVLVSSIVRPLLQLTETAGEYSRGKLDNVFEDTDRKDEVGELTRAVKRLGRSTKIVMDKLAQS